MMEIYDFAAFLQVIIAFYGVYTLSYKMAEKTFLFNIIRLKIKKNSEAANTEFGVVKERCDELGKIVEELLTSDLYKNEKIHVKNLSQGVKYEFETAKYNKELCDKLYEKYVGDSNFSVLAISVILLCILLIIMGIIDAKITFYADQICSTMILVVGILELHCLLFEVSSRLRKMEKVNPGVILHTILFFVGLIATLYICHYTNLGNELCNDIKVYWVWLMIVTLAPPLLYLGYYLYLINKIKTGLDTIKESSRSMVIYYENQLKHYVDVLHIRKGDMENVVAK